VGFTAIPPAEAKEFYGEFPNEPQGEDVDAGFGLQSDTELQKVMRTFTTSCVRSRRPGSITKTCQDF